MFLFFLLAFIGFASPAALYVINKKEKDLKNKALLNTVFGIKFIIDLFFYSVFVFAINPFSILLFIVLNLLMYWLYDQKKNTGSYFSSNEEDIIAKKNLLNDKLLSQIKEEYINTGEIFTFFYKGSNDIIARERNVLVNRIYKKSNFLYIDAFDIDINEDRTFRVDRINF